MNSIIIVFLIFCSLFLISVGILKNSLMCPEKEIIYKYIPRTFEEEQEDQVFVSDIFKSMFVNEDPWIKSTVGYDTRQTKAVNKYFISQY